MKIEHTTPTLLNLQSSMIVNHSMALDEANAIADTYVSFWKTFEILAISQVNIFVMMKNSITEVKKSIVTTGSRNRVWIRENEN